MFDKAQKQFEAFLNPQAWSEQIAKASAEGQAAAQQAIASVQEFAKMEAENIAKLTQARKPEEVLAAATEAFTKRQAFFTAQLTQITERAKVAGEQWGSAVESKFSEAGVDAHKVVETAFGNVKQGLDLAETAVKTVVERAGSTTAKSKKKQ